MAGTTLKNLIHIGIIDALCFVLQKLKWKNNSLQVELRQKIFALLSPTRKIYHLVFFIACGETNTYIQTLKNITNSPFSSNILKNVVSQKI